MPKRLVTGREPVLAEALAWLERKGIPATEISAIAIDARIGQPLKITATFYVSDPAEVAPDAIAPIGCCGIEGHPETSHLCRDKGGVPVRYPLGGGDDAE